MQGRGKEVLGREPDEASVGGSFGEEGDAGVAARVDGPAEDS